MYAVISTSGHQYRVKEGDVLSIQKVDAEVGSTVDFDNVLMVGGSSVQIGTPSLPGVKVVAEIKEQKRDRKVIILKYKRRKNYKRQRGHRQFLTVVEIKKIHA